MFPLITPDIIINYMNNYRTVFCKDAGFNHICNFVTGLIINPNKTLQGIYNASITDRNQSSRRASHKAIFESNGWDANELLKKHREVVSKDHYKKGKKEIISLDWTFAHHDKGFKMFANKKSYDYVNKRYCFFQTVMTATVSNPYLIDCIDIVVQKPNTEKEEKAYLDYTKENLDNMEACRKRFLELIHYYKDKKEYKKKTELALEMVQRIEEENHFPNADYAFDSGVLTSDLATCIENHCKYWISEIEINRKIRWNGQYVRADALDNLLKEQSPVSFRKINVKIRNKTDKIFYVFSKTVFIKKYGKVKLFIIHEKEDLSDDARFLISNAKHWDSKRALKAWDYRWTCETFHEFGKQVTGFESSQVRNEKSVKRHFCLSCVSQSLVQRINCLSSKSEKFDFSIGNVTFGQKVYHITREILRTLILFVKSLFDLGRSCEYVLDTIIPA